MGDFLLRSLVASVVLTGLLNVALRLRQWRPTSDPFGRPGMPGRRRYPIADDAAGPIPPPLGPGDGTSPGRRPKVQVYVPWKAMLIVSIGLTVAVNLVALLAR